MTSPVISPDGKWMWTGTEWIPALNLPVIREKPRTDAFNVKFRLNYPKEMSESRKSVIKWQTFCYIMIYLSSLLITLDGGVSSNSGLLLIFGFFLMITLFGTGLSYDFGIGTVDIVYLKYRYLLKMQLTLNVILFLSPILMNDILFESGIGDTISAILGDFYSDIANINTAAAEIITFSIYFFLTLLPYFVLSVPLAKYWGMDFERNWRNLIREEDSPEKEHHRTSNSLSLGVLSGGICFFLTGWMMVRVPSNVYETVNDNPSIIGDIVLFVGVEIIGGAFLLLAIIMIGISLFHKNGLRDLDNE